MGFWSPPAGSKPGVLGYSVRIPFYLWARKTRIGGDTKGGVSISAGLIYPTRKRNDCWTIVCAGSAGCVYAYRAGAGIAQGGSILLLRRADCEAFLQTGVRTVLAVRDSHDGNLLRPPWDIE